jgi:hypothetical protein
MLGTVVVLQTRELSLVGELIVFSHSVLHWSVSGVFVRLKLDKGLIHSVIVAYYDIKGLTENVLGFSCFYHTGSNCLIAGNGGFVAKEDFKIAFSDHGYVLL